MIPYKNRFHGHNSLTYVYKNGQAVRSSLMTIRYTHNPHRKDSRLAVVVSKKTLKSAVKRNRIRRRIYEYIRTKLPEFNGIYDIAIIVSNAEIMNTSFEELSSVIDKLLEQAGLEKNVPKNP